MRYRKGPLPIRTVIKKEASVLLGAGLMRSAVGHLGEQLSKNPRIGTNLAQTAAQQAVWGDRMVGNSNLSKVLHYKLAPAEYMWPAEVGTAHGKGLLAVPPADRVPLARDLAQLLKSNQKLTSNRTLGYAGSAADSTSSPDFSTITENAPWLPIKREGSASKALHHVGPSALWGAVAGHPASALEHLTTLRATSTNAPGRIADTLQQVREGAPVKKPSVLWGLVGGRGYRNQIEDAAEAAGSFRNEDPQQAKELGKLLARGFHPDHYLHELGSQLRRGG